MALKMNLVTKMNMNIKYTEYQDTSGGGDEDNDEEEKE